jgi:hypothetical protein
MQLLELAAPPLLALSTSGLRGVGRRIAVGAAAVPPTLVQPAGAAFAGELAIGRVHSGGRWSDAGATQRLAAALGAPFAEQLRREFEWYGCRGAHFHTDAHYADVLFGIWMIAGGPANIVFARGHLRVPVSAGSIVLFDPFEVHGVLAPGAMCYDAGDYAAAAPSVFAGFEVALSAAVAAAFGITAAQEGRIVSSTTRVAADTGALQ